MHAHILPYDYDRDTEVAGFGLARTASLITAARAEASNTLLFDAGDFLQGTPLSDAVALEACDPDETHPVIDAMNALEYDAVCLGNHEFNFGLDWLRSTLGRARFPIVCANVATETAPDDPVKDRTFRKPYVVIDVAALDNHGITQNIRLGVIGFAPPQITMWDRAHLEGRVTARDIVQTARAHIPELRKAGAQVVVALAHTGISSDVSEGNTENTALALARVPGIDAILAGHTHNIFPDPGRAGDCGPATLDISHRFGTLAGKPTVMAGYRGSHLGVLDLQLSTEGDGWCVTGHRSEVRAVQQRGAAPAGVEAKLAARAEPAHRAALVRNARTVGHSRVALHSYLAQVRPCPALGPVLTAQRDALAAALRGQGRDVTELPVLSASAPFKTGGYAGPLHYTDVPAGQLSIRHIGDLYPYPNTLVGLRLNGAELRDWLERSVSCFHQVSPGLRCQPLWNWSFASHAFDTVLGVSCNIDLTQPARYCLNGEICAPQARRITNLTLHGAPIDSAQEFMLATNNFRAFSGGPFAGKDSAKIVYRGTELIQELVIRHVASRDWCAEPVRDAWSFSPVAGASVVLHTGPGVRSHKHELDALGATDLGNDDFGFARFDIPL